MFDEIDAKNEDSDVHVNHMVDEEPSQNVMSPKHTNPNLLNPDPSAANFHPNSGL